MTLFKLTHILSGDWLRRNSDFLVFPGYMALMAGLLYAFGIWDFSWLVITGVFIGIFASCFNKREKLMGPFLNLVGSAIFMVYFLSIGLYGMFLSQVFFASLALATLFSWHRRNPVTHKTLKPSFAPKSIIILLVLIFVTAGIVGYVMRGTIGLLDYAVMAGGITGQFLLMRKKIQVWPVWITCDILSVPMYAMTGSWLLVARCPAFMTINTTAFFRWRKLIKNDITPKTAD